MNDFIRIDARRRETNDSIDCLFFCDSACRDDYFDEHPKWEDTEEIFVEEITGEEEGGLYRDELECSWCSEDLTGDY
jgi:hypothetical protein